MILADSAVWIEFLRTGQHGRAARMDSLLADRELCACGPVVAEILTGAGPADRARLRDLLTGLPWADLDREGWSDVGEGMALLREGGRIVALADVAIGVAAARAGAAIWTSDSDFERVAGVVEGLRVEWLD